MSIANSIARVEGILATAKEGDDSLADLLADILHYCDHKGINLNEVYSTADSYYYEDKSYEAYERSYANNGIS